MKDGDKGMGSRDCGMRNLANNGIRGLKNRLDLVHIVGGVPLLDESDLSVGGPGTFDLRVASEAVEEVVGVAGEVLRDVEALDAQLGLGRGRLGNRVFFGLEDGSFEGRGREFDDQGSGFGGG